MRMEIYSDFQVVITLCHNWSVERISGYTLVFGSLSPFHSCILFILSFPVSYLLLFSLFFPILTCIYLFFSHTCSVYFLLYLLVAVSAFVPSSSLLNPTTVESLFIPAPVYLPNLSVCLSFLGSLSCFCVFPSHPPCQFVSFSFFLPVNPTRSPYCTSHISLSSFFLFLTLSLLKPRATVA